MLVGLEIVALIVCGVATVAKFFVWAPINERPESPR
jgi:hypothetical protein